MKTKLFFLAIACWLLATGMATAQEVTKRGITPPRNIRNYDHDQPDALLGQMLGVRPYSSAVGDTLLGYVPVYYLGDSLLMVGTYTVLHTGNFSSLFTGISVSARFTGVGTSGSPLELATVGTGYGGTGITTYTTGDLLYASTTNTLSKRAAGTNGYVLTMSGGVPTWAAAASTITMNPTTNVIPYKSGTSAFSDSPFYTNGTQVALGVALYGSAQLSFNATVADYPKLSLYAGQGYGFGVSASDLDAYSALNHRWFSGSTSSTAGTEVMSLISGQLGLNTPSPSERLHVTGNIRLTSGVVQLADGSAAAPAMSFVTDLDIGVYRKGANQLGFATAGVERFALGAAGELLVNGSAGTSGQVLLSGGTGAVAAWTNFPGVTGSGTATVVPVFTGTSTIGNSNAYITADYLTLGYAGDYGDFAVNKILAGASQITNRNSSSDALAKAEFIVNAYGNSWAVGMGSTASALGNNFYIASNALGTPSVVAQITTAGNSGWGGAPDANRMRVYGNISFSGALMPNGAAGTAGQYLQSAGTGSPPTWVTGTLLPTGTTGQTLRHNGTTWVVSSNLTNDGTNTSFTGAVLGPAGSAAAPAYSFTGDANNGWWSPSADVQAWSTAGTERLRIGATGNIISNNTPSVDWQTTTQFSAFTGSRGLYFTAIGDGITADELALKNPSGSTAFQAAFYEAAANGTSKVEVQAANSMSADYLQTLSPANGEIGVWLRTSATLDFPSTAPGTCSDMSVTLTGVSAGDSALPPGTFSTANTGVWSAHVFSSNTVTVRYCNCVVGTTQDPASQTFNINVKKVN